MHSDDDERGPGAGGAGDPMPDGRWEDQMMVSPPAPAAPPPVRESPLAARLAALFEVLVCSDFPTQLFIAQVLVLAGLAPRTADLGYSITFVATLSLSDAAVLVGLVLWFLHVHGERPRDVLFGRRSPWREAVLGVLLVPLTFLVAGGVLAIIQHLVPSLHNVARNPLEAMIQTPAGAVLFGLVAVVSGGVREEVQRAFILHRFEQHLGGAPLGLFLFSLVFGAGHVIQGWDVALTTVALGIFWGVLYLVRRSIAASVVSHAGFDLVQILGHAIVGH